MNELVLASQSIVKSGKMDASGTWTLLWDMSSGGYHKASFHFIFIQAPAEEAVQWANWKWNIHPDNVTCPCCGPDYSVSQGKLGDIAAYHFTKYYERRNNNDQDWGYTVSKEEVAKRIFQCILDNGRGISWGREEEDYALFIFRDMMGDEYKNHHKCEVSWVHDMDA